MSTSRLKRKAQDDPELLSDASLLENFVVYGTPLPSLTSTKRDQGEYVPVWKQEVRDEKGRRRLHGAFTGGFSAGYFNTVGSKEGWAPSTFVSSKAAKAPDRPAARPEDFMDEEDLAEIKAARSFSTADQYGGAPSMSQQLQQNEDGTNYAASMANAMEDLVKPGTSKIGEKIMLKMGWKPGQGIGPRISWATRKAQLKELRHVDVDADTDEGEEGEPEEAKTHLFPPVDRPLQLFANKENSWGLDYKPGNTLVQELRASDQLDRKGKGREHATVDGRSIPAGRAFGISALEDADDDDQDIYSTSDRRHASSSMIIDEDEEDDVYGSGGGFPGTQLRRPELLSAQRPRVNGNVLGTRKLPAKQEEVQRFHDGTPLIPGFVLAKNPQPPDKWYAPPDVPKGFRPNPQAVWEKERLKEPRDASQGRSASLPGQRTIDKDGKRTGPSNADERAAVLGEKVTPRSVFEYISAKNKERLQSVIANKDAGPQGVASYDQSASSTTQPGMPEDDEAIRVPALEARIAQSALRGFMPYGDDPAKQARYRAFLTYFAAPNAPGSASYSPRPLPGKRTADLNKELADFAGAAAIFKPMSGMMANRFTSGTSAATLLDIKAPDAGLRQPAPSNATKLANMTEEERMRSKEKDEREKDERDPRRLAVKAGQYGPLTRTTENWYPARLLCKRFNVPDPHPEGPAVASGAEAFGAEFGDNFSAPSASSSAPAPNQGTSKEILNDETMNELRRESAGMHRHSLAIAQQQQAKDGASDSDAGQPASSLRNGDSAVPSLANVGLGEDETQGRDTLTYQRPPMEIFKAVFAESEDEDEDEIDGDGDGDTKPAAPLTSTSAPGGTSVQQQSQPLSASIDIISEPPVVVTMDNIATFKPMFVKSKSSSARQSKNALDTGDEEDDKDGKDTDKKTKKKKKKDKKSGAAAALSFDVDEDADGGAESKRDRKDKAKLKSTGQKNKRESRSGESFGEAKEKRESRHEKRGRSTESGGGGGGGGVDRSEKLHNQDDEDEDEWVEKEAPPAVPATIRSGLPEQNGSLRTDSAQAQTTPANRRNPRMTAAELF